MLSGSLSSSINSALGEEKRQYKFSSVGFWGFRHSSAFDSPCINPVKYPIKKPIAMSNRCLRVFIAVCLFRRP